MYIDIVIYCINRAYTKCIYTNSAHQNIKRKCSDEQCA